MSVNAEFFRALPRLDVRPGEPLRLHTRFALGGPADLYAETADEATFVEAARLAAASGQPWITIGLGTNLVVADAGYRGIVLRFAGADFQPHGSTITAQAGAELQALVDASIDAGLAGMEVMTGIPGTVGAAIHGNAGAYGQSISDCVRSVRFFDGAQVVELDHDACEFRYRASRFHRTRRGGLILSALFEFRPGDAAELRARATRIRDQRNQKFPSTLLCAGSTFKNLLLAELPAATSAKVPANVVKGGKVPAAWFLDQIGARGLSVGGIRVKQDHANTLYNDGTGTAADFAALSAELRRRVRERFAIELEEEVQRIGFED
jgi:UDP-N-acetylmuramate dehydrogenase